LTGGDYGSVCQLFFDNLSTLLGALFALQGLGNADVFGPIAVSSEIMEEIVWGKIVPGVGMTMVIGNFYYTWQAIRCVMER
jgi:adenine/guanine/hypoxanthine permease